MKIIRNVDNVVITKEYDFNKTPYAIEFCDGNELKIRWEELKNAPIGYIWKNTRDLLELDSDTHSDYYLTEVTVIAKGENFTLIEYRSFSEWHKDYVSRDLFIW